MNSILLSLFVASSAEAQPGGNMGSSEADRLYAVRALIQGEASRRLQEKDNPSAALCEALLDRLLLGKDIDPIEPFAILSNYYPARYEKRDPAFAKSAQFNLRIKKELKRCANQPAGGDDETFNAFNSLAGSPPFRLYLIPVDSNPYPDSSLVYASEYDFKIDRGGAGYSWVNMNTCKNTTKTFSPVDAARLKVDPTGQAVALTQYRGNVVAWSVSRNQSFFADHFERNVSGRTVRTICQWATYAR